MSVEVTLTVRFSFEHGSAKPTMGEIDKFVKALDADPREMIATYRIAEERSLFVKFKTEEAMEHCLQRNGEQLAFTYGDGKSAAVRMSPAGGNVQYVRIYDLPPEVPDSDIAVVIGRYGVVKRVVREKFPADLNFDMYTGVRGVYVDVEKEIPNSLHFRNRRGNVYYEGNRDLCFLCNKKGHRMNVCPKKKNRKQPEQPEQPTVDQEEEERGTSTYAKIVAGAAPTEVNNGEDVDQAIEVMDEEVVDEQVVDEQVVDMNVTSPENAESTSEETVAENPQPRVFKHHNDAYYFYKFGIEDYTEKERIKDEEEAKRMALWKENRAKEERALRERKKAEAKLNSPPKKNRKC